MIDHLDSTLRHLFMSRVAGLVPTPPAPVTEDQVGFQPPDEDWRTHVSGLGTRRALNVYLVDLRENRKLRSNERRRSVENGVVCEEPAPARVDCHFLISAWSPATEEAGRTTDEHMLLHEVLAVLMHHQPLVPRSVYQPDPLPVGFPETIADAELPTVVAPAEGFPKLAELWGTMGVNHRWKPVVYLVVTLPVSLVARIAGPMVTTRITEYRQVGSPETAEVWVQIGGHLRDGTVDPPAPVPGAWVRLETPAGVPLQTTETDEDGRFTFAEIGTGAYRLRARAAGHPEVMRDVEAPSPSGEYDLELA